MDRTEQVGIIDVLTDGRKRHGHNDENQNVKFLHWIGASPSEKSNTTPEFASTYDKARDLEAPGYRSRIVEGGDLELGPVDLENAAAL